MYVNIIMVKKSSEGPQEPQSFLAKVKNLPQGDSKALKRIFKDCGDYQVSTVGEDYAVLEFSTKKQLKNALEMNGCTYKKQKIKVKKTKKEAPQEGVEVVVGNLPLGKEERALEKVFKKCPEYQSRVFQGFARVKFDSEKSAKSALKKNRTVYREHEILVNKLEDLPSSIQRKEGPTTVFVGGINSTTTEEQLRSFFSGCGNVKRIHIATDPSGNPKGFAHVEFTNPFAPQTAVNLAGKKLNGKPLKVDIAEERSKAPQRGRSVKLG